MALTKVTGSVIKDSVSLSGNVSVGGTLTYQDVTNVDALGVGTFRSGINVSGGQLDVGSNVKIGNAGIVTASNFKTGVTNLHSTGLTLTGGQLDVGSNIKVGTAGVITATTFSGSGANLTALNASNIASGTIADARISTLTSSKLTGALPAISGANLTNLDASDLASGTVPTARLGSGTANNTTFLRGDSTFAAVTSVTISNNANNRVITGGSGTNLVGESNLTFDGSGQLSIAHTDPKIALVDTSNNTDAYIFSDNNGSIQLQADQNSEASDSRIRLSTDGTERVSIDNNLTILNGNLVIGTSGKGIDFSATANATVMGEGFSTTAPTMDNELLKSYERGTWTGTIRGYDHAGGAGWGNVATTAGTNSATGRYMKIGNLVTCFIKFSGITWDTSWTYFSIVGVPFGHNHYDGAGGFCLAQDTNSFTNTGMTVMGNVHGSQGYLVGQQPNGTTNLTLDTSNSNRIITASLVFYTSTGG